MAMLLIGVKYVIPISTKKYLRSEITDFDINITVLLIISKDYITFQMFTGQLYRTYWTEPI